jgi:hypothetical protein
MSDQTRKTVVVSVVVVLLAALGVWWYFGFSLQFMQFFAAEPGVVVSDKVECSPATQTVSIGTSATLSAIGGQAPYTWYVFQESGIKQQQGETLNVTYTTSGIKKVLVRAGNDTVSCTVIVKP